MPAIPPAFLAIVEETLRFAYQAGDVTPLGYPHSTGWRILPGLMAAQAVGGRVRVDLAGGCHYVVEDGQAFCILPGVHHKAEKITHSPSVSRWAHLDFSILNAVPLFALLEISSVFSGETAQQIGDINAELARLHQSESRDLTYVFQKKALALHLAALLCREAQLTAQGAAFFPLARRLAPALAFIEENLAQPLTRDGLASLLCLSPSRFAAVFSAALGQSPSGYIQGLRLQKAQRMLLSTDDTITDIAARVGYDDPFHFSRLFKKRFGASPAHYRVAVKLSYP